LLDAAVEYLTERRWTKDLGTGWEAWDLALYCHPLFAVHAVSVQEDHAGGRRLVRIRFSQRPRSTAWLLFGLGLTASLLAATTLNPWVGLGIALTTLLVAGLGWSAATGYNARAIAVFDHAAKRLDFFRCRARQETESVDFAQPGKRP
jgi:hypothetical protein